MQLRANYLRDCANFSGTYTIDIEYESERHLPKHRHIPRGLASALILVTMSFTFAQFLEPPRRFHIIAAQWNYGAFRKTFQDFSSESVCPITSFVPSNALRDARVYLKWNGDVVVEDNDVLYELNILPVDLKHYEAYDILPLRLGKSKYFEKMSVVARAVFVPQPSIMRIIQDVWENLTSQNVSYTFVHVRRGDKRNEARIVPISTYAEKLNTENTRRNHSVTTVFLMCDGYKTCDEFRLALGGSYCLVTYKTLMQQWGLWNASMETEEHTQIAFDQLSEEKRLMQALELVVSLYIGALSSFTVCSYSSNICKFIALLRGGKMDHNGVYSVDDPSWGTTAFQSRLSTLWLQC
ncbi:hypothetical protein RvY_01752 [Ramazzottius varieornatus]|uniref:O-fucosyltransferase family protein n=1 Tax=Ramazzottius varieornatus TaxID=947166 RepID=A0A1D1UKV1_RAMVA|nr:hypothetical protein RvY_01752 [Ramazzottius varieornatus]